MREFARIGKLHTLGSYARGYVLAANLVIDAAIVNPLDMDYLAVPALALYRQGIELFMKEIIRLRGVPPLTTHDLGKLWNLICPTFENMWSGDSSVHAIEHVVIRLSKLDDSGQKMRYVKNKEGQPYWDKTEGVDLLTVKEEVGKASEALDGAVSYLLDMRTTPLD